jgi:hypothetical protein
MPRLDWVLGGINRRDICAFMRPSLAAFAALFAFVLHFASPSGFAQQDAAKQAEAIPFGQIPARLAKLDEEWTKQLDSVKKVIDGEEAAKRITEATAQSLRWSVRGAAVTYYDNRSTITNAKVPADNAMLAKAFRETEELLASQQQKRTEIVGGISRELRRQLSKLVNEPSKLADVDAVQTSIDEIQALRQRGSLGGAAEVFSKLQNAEPLLRMIKLMIEAETNGDVAKLQGAAGFLRNVSLDRDLVPEQDLRNRVEAAIKPYQKAEDEAEKALIAALEAKKSAEEIDDALKKYTKALENMRMLSARDGRQERDFAPYYRTLAEFWKTAATADGQTVKDRAQQARNILQYLGADTAAKFGPLLAQMEEDALGREKAMISAETEKLRRRISEAKTLADVEALLALLHSPNQDRRYYEDSSAGVLAALSAISNAWRTNSLPFLQNFDGTYSSSASPYIAELTSLRLRAEREIFAQTLRAFELTRPPLSEQPTNEAIETLCDQLAQKREWRRLLQLLDTRAMLNPMEGRYGRPQGDETATAIRAYFVAQNFELAEMWKDAADSYRSVLRSTSQRAPITDAAERLKKLIKEHPEP